MSTHRYDENVYGFTVGGPIKKSGTFFFAALQQNNFRSSGQDQFIVLTGEAVAQLRALFPLNPHLDLYLSALGSLRGLYNLFPVILGADPLTGMDRGTVTFGTARWLYPSTSDETQGLLRFDHWLSPVHQISFRYLNDRKVESPFEGDAGPPSFPGYFADGDTGDHNLLLTADHLQSQGIGFRVQRERKAQEAGAIEAGIQAAIGVPSHGNLGDQGERRIDLASRVIQAGEDETDRITHIRRGVLQFQWPQDPLARQLRERMS